MESKDIDLKLIFLNFKLYQVATIPWIWFLFTLWYGENETRIDIGKQIFLALLCLAKEWCDNWLRSLKLKEHFLLYILNSRALAIMLASCLSPHLSFSSYKGKKRCSSVLYAGYTEPKCQCSTKVFVRWMNDWCFAAIVWMNDVLPGLSCLNSLALSSSDINIKWIA